MPMGGSIMDEIFVVIDDEGEGADQKKILSAGLNIKIADRSCKFPITKNCSSLEEFELEIIDAGVEDIDKVEDKFIIYCQMEDFGGVQKKLEEMEIESENAELQRIPINTKELSKEEALKILKIIDEFEEIDDVQNVYHNLEITDELMAELENE